MVWFRKEYNSKLFQFTSGTSDYVLDVASLAEKIGLSNWHDQVSYNIAKVPFCKPHSIAIHFFCAVPVPSNFAT